MLIAEVGHNAIYGWHLYLYLSNNYKLDNLGKRKVLYYDYDDDFNNWYPETLYHLTDSMMNYKMLYIVIEDPLHDNFTQMIDVENIQLLKSREISFSTYKLDLGFSFYDNNIIKMNYNNPMPGNPYNSRAHLVIVIGIN